MSWASRGPDGDNRLARVPRGLRSSPVHGKETASVMTHDGFARQSTGGRHGLGASNPVGRHPRRSLRRRRQGVRRDRHGFLRDSRRQPGTPAPDRSGNASSAHEAAANSVIRRALLIEPATGGRDGKIDFDVDPVRGINPKERVVPRRPVPAGGKRSIATPVAGPRMARRANSCLPIAWVPAVSEPELLLPDVPLIVEDLLLQARQLADAGAPTEAVKAILDHVAALREGRG